MKGIVIHSSKNKQICLCGVDGAGKKTFCSLFAPGKEISIKNISLKRGTNKCLIIVMFDGLRQQNTTEENLLNDVQKFVKSSPIDIELEVWCVLTKVDMFYNKRKDPNEIERNFTSYMNILLPRNIRPTLFIPLSQIAYLNLRYITQYLDNDCEEECLDLSLILGRIGIRFTNDNDFEKLKEYVKHHESLLTDLSGVGIINKHLLSWLEGDSLFSRRMISSGQAKRPARIKKEKKR